MIYYKTCNCEASHYYESAHVVSSQRTLRMIDYKTLQLCGFFPLWVSPCRFNIEDVVNDLLQDLHLCGFSPLWICSCCFKLEDCVND